MKIFNKIKNNREIVVLILISGFGVLAGSLLAPVEAIYLNTLTDHKTLLGLTFAIGTLSIFLFSIYISRLEHKFNRKKLALLGFGAGLMYPIIYATSFNIFQYMFGRVSWAFAAVISGIMIDALFQDFISKKKNIGEIAGIRSSVGAICGTSGAVVGGYLADGYGLKIPYYFVIVIYILLLTIFISFVYNKIDEKPREKEHKKFHIRESLRDIIKHPFLFLRVFLEGITQSHWTMEPIIFPLIIFELTGGNTATGIVFGLMGVVAMFTLPTAGRYIDKKTSVHGLKISFILYAIAFAVLYMSQNIILFTAGALLLSLGKSFNGPSFVKIETKYIASKKRIEYLSYFKAYDTLTATATAITVGILLDLFTPQMVLLFFMIFTIVGGNIGFRLFENKHKAFTAAKK